MDDLLARHPLHPTARARVYAQATRRLLDNPEEPPEQAVQAALVATAVQCVGCGLYVAPGAMVVLACDACGRPVCPACMRALASVGGGGMSILTICPRCFARLPRDPDDIAAFRRLLQHGPSWQGPPTNGRPDQD